MESGIAKHLPGTGADKHVQCRPALGGQWAERFSHPTSQIIEQRLGEGLTNGAAKFSRLATDVFFDAVHSADARVDFGGNRRCVDDMN
jgi:hypothetical protein